MMELPNGGKVVIVDDCKNEVEPLIDILSSNNIPVLYFSGKEKSLPNQPLVGVRVVFLDLRFGPNIDELTNVANACSVLKKIIGEKSGPFVLITWSSNDLDCLDKLNEVLVNEKIQPEKIISLSKTDYFRTETEEMSVRLDNISEIIDNADLDVNEKRGIIRALEKTIYTEIDESKKVFIEEKYDDLCKALEEAIQSAGLISFFVVWENSIQSAASKAVTNIYEAIPENIPAENRIMAVANSLAKNVLEQQYDGASAEERLQAAFIELNDLFTYFYEDETSEIEKKICGELKGGNEKALNQSRTKLNTWKLMRFRGKDKIPGRIYIDEKQRFKWASLAKNEDSINNVMSKINDYINENCTYIYINVNGECETAQKKAKYMKIIPGLIIKKKQFDKVFNISDLKSRDDLMVFEPFSYKEEDNYMIFSLDQTSYIEFSEVSHKSLFILNRKYYYQVRQKIANNYFKQGLDLYK